MDKTQRLFDAWATNGRAARMEKEHKKTASKILDAIPLKRGFKFLDIGCGNGWVTRWAASHDGCTLAVGIDKSAEMVRHASSRASSDKERYYQADIESWKPRQKFDYAFAMESIYYAASPEAAIRRIYGLLRPGGVFYCGTDYYAENKTTSKWSDSMDVVMHLYSREQWRRLFAKAGFSARTRLVPDAAGNTRWKRELGTLFVVGVK